MLKRLLYGTCAILLLMAFLWPSMHRSFIRISYEINKSEIIAKFCINKDEPEMSCEGKCHMQSELKKTSTQDEYPATTEIDYPSWPYHPEYFKTQFDFSSQALQWSAHEFLVFSKGYYQLVKPPPRA